jgi:hypothetical protein
MNSRLMYVKWADAYADGGTWTDPADIHTTHLEVESVGWLWAQNAKAVTLVQSVCDDDGNVEILNYQTVPKGMILEMREIKLGP